MGPFLDLVSETRSLNTFFFFFVAGMLFAAQLFQFKGGISI